MYCLCINLHKQTNKKLIALVFFIKKNESDLKTAGNSNLKLPSAGLI